MMRRFALALPLAAICGCSADDTTGPPADRLSFVDITAGYYHSCGLEADGDVYCWGTADDGQVGSLDLDICGDSIMDGPDCALTPRRVQTDIPMRAISAGGEHTCAIAANSRAYCWGDNTQSQLGAGTVLPPCGDSGSCWRTPIPVAATDYVSISAGGAHTCALKEDGRAQCWGYGHSGRLGTGTTGDLSQPMTVLGGHTFSVISAGGTSTCAITVEGVAYCWGYNHLGQLGNGTIEPRAQPAPVLTDLRFTDITVATAHACALTAEGAVYCWGANAEGELGTGEAGELCGSYPCDTTPRLVLGAHTFTSITTGANATCGDTSGGVLCWGSNDEGATGTQHSDTVTLPTPVPGVALRLVDASYDHACALDAAGHAYCWGSNWKGALGTGDRRINSTSPVPVVAP